MIQNNIASARKGKLSTSEPSHKKMYGKTGKIYHQFLSKTVNNLQEKT